MGSSEIRPRSLVVIVVIFIAAFLCAGSFLIVIGHFGFNTPRSLSFNDETVGAASVTTVANPLVVNRAGIYKKILSDESLNPTLGQDYMFFAWFRLRKALQAGAYVGLVGKFEAQTTNRPGFAISLEGAPDGIRPRVYWSGSQGRGRWYSFASRHVRQREWYLLAVSFSRNTFLSAYMTPANSDSQPDTMFLGGHKIEPTVIASSGADLLVGAYGASQFRGEVGSFGVVKGRELKGRVTEILQAIHGSPDKIPLIVAPSLIQLWASPDIDRGPQHLTIISESAVQRSATAVNREPKLPKASRRAPPPKKHKSSLPKPVGKKAHTLG